VNTVKIVGEILSDVVVFVLAVVVASGSCTKTGGFCGQARTNQAAQAARPSP
jgi:coenzyme F420-reducing hydrogenase gamma subunit